MAVSTLAGAVTTATVASAGTAPAACSATPVSTTTCTTTLHLTSGTFAVHHNAPTTFTRTLTFTKPLTTGFTGTENPASGGIRNGTLTLLPKNEANKGSVETIIWRQVSAGTTVGTITNNGQVTLTAQMQVIIKITSPITTSCLSTPITVTLKSTTAYDPTSHDVTVADDTFAVPDFVSTPTYPCSEAISELNTTFPGPTGNELTFQLHGVLLAPPKPTVASATTLTVSPKRPAATGGTVVGQPATLTAAVTPGGIHGASGSVQFLATTADLGAPVAVAQGATTSTATLTASSLPVGTSKLKAVYSGDGTYLPSTSAIDSYQAVAAPTVNVALPTKVVKAGLSSPTEFSGVIADPASNGPTLPHVRLTFTLSGLFMTFTPGSVLYSPVALSVCTTPSYLTCTAVTLAPGRNTPTTGHYGGQGTTSMSLNPGTQLHLYFELAFTATEGYYGNLNFRVGLATTTANGTAANVTVASQTGTVLVMKSSPSYSRIYLSQTTANTSTWKETRQGYVVQYRARITGYRTKTAPTTTTYLGPSATGTVTFYRAPSTAPSTVQAIDSITVGQTNNELNDMSVNITAKYWPTTKTYDITASYSGDTFYEPTTTVVTPVTLRVLPPAGGTAYACTYNTGTTSVPAYVTSVTGGNLPASAASGSAVPVSGLTVTAYVDPLGFTLPSTTSVATVNTTFSPEGGGTGTPSEVNPYGVAIDSKTHTAYVSVGGSNNVLAIDEQTNTEEAVIPVGNGPEGVAVDPGAGTTGLVYVANQVSNTVSVINAATNKVVNTITVGRKPSQVAVDPQSDTVYVTNSGSNSVSVIKDTALSTTITASIGTSPVRMAIDPTAGVVYVTYQTTATPTKTKLTTIDAATNTVTGTFTGLPVTADRGTLAVNPKTEKLYVADRTAVLVLAENGTSGPSAVAKTISGFTTGNYKGIAVDPTAGTTGEVYLTAASATSTAYAFPGNTSAAATATKITVGRTSVGVAVDPTLGTDGTVYMASPYLSQRITKVSGTTKAVVGTITTTAGSVSEPTVGGVKQPLTKQVNFDVAGAVEVTGTGPVPVGLQSFTYDAVTRTSSVVLACTAVTKPAVIGTVNAIPLSKPTVTTQPQSQTVNAGQTATFSAAATGELPPTVQWQVSSNGTTWTNITGATADSYTTAPTTGTESGWQYRALFTNASGTTPSDAATLTVDTAPTVVTQPVSAAVVANTPVTFTAAASARPTATVQWQVSGDGGTTWTTVPGATSTTLTFTPTTATNDHQYRAVFTNSVGSTPSQPAILEVTWTGNYAPLVTAQPSSATVTAGTPVTLSATGIGHPTPSVGWQVSTDGGKTWSAVPGAGSATYRFSPAASDSGNQYRAVFTNRLGSATSDVATVTVTTTAYRLAGADGAIYAFGGAPYYGSMGGQPLDKPIVGIADTPTDGGYWEVASDGGIFSFGNATFYGSMGGQALNAPIVGMAAAPTGKGYWEVASDGGIFAFGSATFSGSMGGQPLNKPIVGMTAAPTGKGYWEVASDGGIFAFGSATFYGSTGSLTLDKPIVGMAAAPDGKGYWLVASDGGIFAYGDAGFFGSGAGGSTSSVVGMAATDDGGGYWLTTATGAVTGYGDAPLAGSMAGKPLNAPIVGITG